MKIDVFTVMLMTAVVVNVSGIAFIVETLVRRDEGAGRVWALGFLAGMLTTIAYTVSTVEPTAWWAVAVGNAAFAASAGCMWLGARRFNQRRMMLPAIVVALASCAPYLAVLAEGPDGGWWAGAVVTFLAIALCAGLGCVECLRGDMARTRTSYSLAVVLGVQCAYLVARAVVFAVAGPDSSVFTLWFGTANMAFLTITLTIVALVVTSVLRAGRADVRGLGPRTRTLPGQDGILPHDVFLRVLGEIADRAQWRGELLAVIAVKIEDLEQISTAFGSEVARSVRETWRLGVRRYPPSDAVVGEDGLSSLLFTILAESPSEARRQAALVYRGLFEDLGAVSGGVIPAIGVGVAMSDAFGYDAAALEQAARDAADRAASSIEASVLVGEPAG